MNKIEIIFFSGDSCPKCKAIKGAWDELVSANPQFDFRYINTSTGDLALARQYNVQALPTFIATSSPGAVKARMSGEVSKKMLFDFLTKL